MSSAPSPASNRDTGVDDVTYMHRAMALAALVRSDTAPNPWVGCVVVTGEGVFEGATAPPGGSHAEARALAAAGSRAQGATLYTTLEPCAHHGRTPPCSQAIIEAGVARVVVGMVDPDPLVSGAGLADLRAAGIIVEVGVAADEVADQLSPYTKHRLTGRPWVVLKLAASFDGRIAAPDGSSRWITGAEAREDAHLLRSVSDAVLVGAGTIRADDPELTVRLAAGSSDDPRPLRVVLGTIPEGARIEPALALSGELGAVLDELGRRGVLQVLVEGGARVAHEFHAAGLVDRYVLYVAPVIFGGDDAVPLFAGPGSPTMDRLWRGRFVSVRSLGDDIRIELAPGSEASGATPVGEAA